MALLADCGQGHRPFVSGKRHRATLSRPMTQAPLNDALIRALPKTDLHVHLDGSLRVPTLIELARERKLDLPSWTEEGMNALVFKPTYTSLVDYLAGFAWTCGVMQDAEALERIAYEFARDNQEEGVRYVEVRFAPQLHSRGDFSLLQVLQAVQKGMDRAKAEFNAALSPGEPPFHYGIIVCAMRMFNEYFSDYYRQLISVLPETRRKNLFGIASMELAKAAVKARDEHGVPVVGFDLAGQEDGFPAMDHADAYAWCHRKFLHKTVHAGEAYGPESIFQSLTELHADRIGHGLLLFAPESIQDPTIDNRAAFCERLANHMAENRTTIEVCITSNLQTTPRMKRVEDHPLRTMLDHRMSVTLCTDNRLMSHTTVSKEIGLAIQHLNMDHKELRNVLIHGFKRSFFPGSYAEKRAWVRQVIDYYDRVMLDATGVKAG